MGHLARPTIVIGGDADHGETAAYNQSPQFLMPVRTPLQQGRTWAELTRSASAHVPSGHGTGLAEGRDLVGAHAEFGEQFVGVCSRRRRSG